MDELYLSSESSWVLYDLRDQQACEHLHQQRAAWQESSELAALGPDHTVLMLFPGGAAIDLSGTKEAQHD